MSIFIIFLLQFVIFRSISSDDFENPKHKVEPIIVFSISSFRWDFANRIKVLCQLENRSSNLWELIDGGAYAPNGIASVFTTDQYPNEYTLVTGLYEESHGVISDDVIYDPILKRNASLQTQNPEDRWVLDGEPIWETLSNQGRIVGCCKWFGCAYSATKNCVLKNNSWSNRIAAAIDWLIKGVPLILVSNSELDDLLKTEEPDSENVNKSLLQIDSDIGSLMAQLKEENLFNVTNLIILSDHGISKVKNTKAIFSEKSNFPKSFSIRSQSPTVWLVDPIKGMDFY